MTVLFGIPTNGRNAFATKAVESALAQSRPPDDLRVVEDGIQTDPFVWKGLGKVEVTRHTVKGGPMVGRNEMMLNSEADIFVGLDDDSYFADEDVIEKAGAVFEDNPMTAALYFEVLTRDDSERKPRTVAFPVRTFVGCGHALRLAAVKEVGGYELMPGLYYGEESDLSLRLLDHGWSTLKMPGFHVFHERSATSRDTFRERRWGVLNDLTLIWRRCPKPWLAARLIGNACRQILFSLSSPRRYLVPTFAGLFDFVRAWPDLWKSRKPVKPESWVKYRELP